MKKSNDDNNEERQFVTGFRLHPNIELRILPIVEDLLLYGYNSTPALIGC